MTPPLFAPELLAFRLGDLQRRAHTLHGDATDRFIRAKLRALSIQMRQIAATLRTTPGVLTAVIASELLEAALVLLQRLEQDAHRQLGEAR